VTRLLQYALTGLSAGSLYALVALGIVLIYRSTRVLNFAHGAVATFGTFVAFGLLTSGAPFAVAFPK
jgi:branched-chain amino acid transport system permease protein